MCEPPELKASSPQDADYPQAAMKEIFKQQSDMPDEQLAILFQQLEEALQESENRFRTMAETAPVMLWSAGTDALCDYFNHGWLSFTGRSLDQEQGNGWLESVHCEDVKTCVATYRQAFEQRQAFTLEYRLRRHDGEYRWILDRGAPRFTRSGTFVGYIGSAIDITERKQAEALLHTAHQNLEKQVEERTAELQAANAQLKAEIAERQRVEATLRQQTEWQHLIGEIQARIRQSLDLEDILETAVAEVRQFLQVERVALYQLQPHQGGAFIVESVAPGVDSLVALPGEDPYFESEYALHYQQGQVSAIADIYQANLSPAYIELLEKAQIRANLLVPVVSHNHLWGFLCAHQCSETRAWQPLEIQLLKQIATQLAIAIQQSELYQQVQKLNSDLETQVQERTTQLQQAWRFESLLKRITDKVRDSLDEHQILQTAVQELTVELGVACCNAALYNHERDTATIYYEHTVSMPGSQGRVAQMSKFPEIYRQLHRGWYFQFCSLLHNPARGQTAMLACPIFMRETSTDDSEQAVLGDLWLVKSKHQEFSELEIRLVQQVANQCAIAIRQARLYQAAQSQVTELEKVNQLKDDFLSIVSHELRTPLTNMNMAIQMLGIALNREQSLFAEFQKPETEQSRTARYYQILSSECEREIKLVNDLLDLQRLDADVQPRLLTSVQLQEWLPPIVNAFQDRTQAQDQHLQMELPNAFPTVVLDHASLSRIMTELLNNACKYTPRGERIIVRVQTQGNQVQLSVTNTGVEIPTSELPRIFEKFYRVPSSDPWRQGGAGLGLSLVRKLVSHMDGTLEVESSSGQTRFIILLPFKQA